LATALVDADQTADLQGVWRKLAAAHPDHADIFQLACLATFDSRWNKFDDWEFVAPLLDERISAGRRIAHHAAILRLRAATEAEDSMDRTSLRQALTDLVAGSTDDPASYAALALLLNTPSAQVECKALQDALIEHAEPKTLTKLAREAGVDEALLRRMFIGKRVAAEHDAAPLNTVIEALENEVDLPLWIDDAVRDDESPVTIDRSGRWIDVVQGVLASSPHEIVMLGDDVLWIGPAERRKEARDILRASVSKLPDGADAFQKRIRERLAEPTISTMRIVPLEEINEGFLLPIHVFCTLGERLIK
jgi:hypothetical protein